MPLWAHVRYGTQFRGASVRVHDGPLAGVCLPAVAPVATIRWRLAIDGYPSMTMHASDPRHGTYGGAVQHQKDGDGCRPCAYAKAAYMRQRRKLERADKCAMTEGHVPGTRSGLGWPLRTTATIPNRLTGES